MDDAVSLSAPEIHSYLTRVCYARRSKVDPYYNQFAVGGVNPNGKKKGEMYLGYTDLYGTTFEDKFVATGFGANFALPLMRKAWRADMSEAEARKLLANVMRVLFYRDCRTINRITFGVIDKDGVRIGDPVSVNTDWNLEEINPVKAPDMTIMQQDEDAKQDV